MKRANVAIIALLLLAGCESELDTGYKPKKLGVTPEERRGYYAPQFSPEAEQAVQGDKDKAALHRPTEY